MSVSEPASPTAIAPDSGQTRSPVPPPKLGEELPVFCEKCGYSLHGLPMQRCSACNLLQFHCPECGNHQHINTLRPAAQKLLGRLRAAFLVWIGLVKIAVFLGILIAWAAVGSEYSMMWESGQFKGKNYYHLIARPVDIEAMAAFAFFGLGTGMFWRMILLRWRRGWAVGIALAVLVAGAVIVGTRLRMLDNQFSSRVLSIESPTPFTGEYLSLIRLAMAMTILGACIVWPIWYVLIRLVFPARTAKALLDWQCNMSKHEGELARE